MCAIGVVSAPVIFVETPIFTLDVRDLLSDDEYSDLQQFLIADPDAGDVIQGTGGLRKVRWSAAGKGKRSGVRVIYYYADAAYQFRMILIYKKGIKDDLTAAEKK